MAATAFKLWREQLKNGPHPYGPILTQEDAARHLGVTLRTVQHWEAGSIDPPEIALRLMTAIAAGSPHEPWGPELARDVARVAKPTRKTARS